MEDFRFENYYGDGERVIFKGRQGKKVYPIVETVFFGIVFIITLLADGFMMGSTVYKAIAGEKIVFEVVLFILAFSMHMVPLALWGMALLKKYFDNKNVYYLITDKRASKILVDEIVTVESAELGTVTDIRVNKNKLVFCLAEGKMVFENLEDAQGVCNSIVAAFSDGEAGDSGAAIAE